MNTNEIVLKWNQKRKGRSSSWFKEKGGDGSNSVFFFPFFDDLQHIYLNSLRVKDFSYGDSPLERYLIWFSYFKYGTRLFNGTSRQQAYSCIGLIFQWCQIKIDIDLSRYGKISWECDFNTFSQYQIEIWRFLLRKIKLKKVPAARAHTAVTALSMHILY